MGYETDGTDANGTLGAFYCMVSRGGWDAWLDVTVAVTLSPCHPEGTSMGESNGNWRWVALGMQLKYLAMWWLLLAPIAGFYLLFQRPAEISWLTGIVIVALVPDFIGRSLCLAAPVARTGFLRVSVGLQFFAIGCLSSSWLTSKPDSHAIAIVVAAALQALAATFFTMFLSDLTRQLGREDLYELTRKLQNQLAKVGVTGAFLGISSFVVFMAVAVAALLTCGIGLILIIPGFVILSPVFALTGIACLQLMGSYRKLLLAIREAVAV